MATTGKLPKEKPHTRLNPRPTVASAARAARNATNRNLQSLQPTQKPSPTRIPPYPTKPKSPVLRTSQKSDPSQKPNVSNEDVSLAQECPSQESVPVIDKQETDAESYVVDKCSKVIIEESESKERLDQVPSVQAPQQESVNLITSKPEVTSDDSPDNEALRQEDIFEIKQCDESEQEKNTTIPILTTWAESNSVDSRPQTPQNMQITRSLSRPGSSPASAPGSRPSSRPQTPRCPSRPTTPQHFNQRPTTPVSRPNTPLRAQPSETSKLPRPKNSSRQFPASVTAGPQAQQLKEDDVKTIFTTKQKKFHRLKKELDLKQQEVLEVFDCLRSLSKRMSQENLGCGEGLQDLVVFNVGDWTTEEIAQLCRDAAASNATDGAFELLKSVKPFDESTLSELDSKVTKVPSMFADLCIQAFTARQELIDWVKEFLYNVKEDAEMLNRITHLNDQGLELCEALRVTKTHADDAVETVVQISRRACRERGALLSVGESLVREVGRLRQDLEARDFIPTDMSEIDLAKSLRNLRRDLEEEKAARNAAREKLATADSQLRQARARIAKMDRQLREAETTITSLSSTVRGLEEQSRQREVQLEARARKLKETLKTGEVATSQAIQQRDALQSEVQTLKEQIEVLNSNHKAAYQEWNIERRDLKTALEEQRNQLENEHELRHAAEAKINAYERKVEELNMKLIEYENKPNTELPSEREMDLWAELQATKDTLRVAEDEIVACKKEKSRFLETLTKIADSESKVGIQQKLAAELLGKEEVIGQMQNQIRELTKNAKLNEQKVLQYEQYVRELQASTRVMSNCQDAPNGVSYRDLQQEIMNLKMSLLDAEHRNEKLAEVLSQKEQQLEQQEKTARTQARVIKVREELINMLKNKESEQSRELSALQQDLEHRMKIVDEVNKQIAAKADEIQELFTTLENKQQQIHRLEKIVLALEEQQRRAQAQRTRHEEKIAALEHELAAGNHKERKFLFF